MAHKPTSKSLDHIQSAETNTVSTASATPIPSVEELNALLAQGQLKKIEAPMLYASGVQMMMTGNDVTLIFTRPRPIENSQGGGVIQQFAMSEVVAIISVTPQTAKDLMVLASANIPRWEKDYGEIKTPFTERLKEELKKQKK